jgi:predicted secreted hydrolase
VFSSTIHGISSESQIQSSLDDKILSSKELFFETVYDPKNITPKNVSYHWSEHDFQIEWWYFEGIFTNGYNAVVNIIIFSKKDIGFCITHLNIFHKTDISEYYGSRKIQSFSKFQGSNSIPNISINQRQIISFNQEKYNSSKQWIYTVNFEQDNNRVNLSFTGLSPGWEGKTLGGYYGPVLPIANVSGSIYFNDTWINVTGLGYHEHAHGISFPIREWGWYWGKIVGENTSLFWGKMMNTRWDEQARAGVFSVKNESFININPDYINMVFSEYCFHSNRFIPTQFLITVSDRENDIFINVNMKTIHIFHLPFGFINYWRYLIKIDGYIVYKNVREEIRDETQILELMRFR